VLDKEGAGAGFKFRDERPERVGGGVGYRLRVMRPFASQALKLRRDGAKHSPADVIEATIPPGAALEAGASLIRALARQKKLVGGFAEKIGDPIEVLQRNAAGRVFERVAEPAFRFSAP